MPDGINIVVTCSRSKRLESEDYLRLEHVRSENIRDRFKQWVNNIERADQEDVPVLPANQMYSGATWHAARKLKAAAESQGFESSAWIISAGYGLIGDYVPIHSYGAAFSKSASDSISAGLTSEKDFNAEKDWWELLGGWEGPSPGSPRSIYDLAIKYPSRTLLVVLSKSYLKAVDEDLINARDVLDDPNQLVIISTGTSNHGLLSRNLLPSSSEFRLLVGGVLSTLNPRLAKRVIMESNENAISAEVLHAVYTKLLKEQPPLPKISRQRLPANEVEAYIRNATLNNPKATKSGLLKQYRVDGFAFEQKKFFALFEKVSNKAIHKGTEEQIAIDWSGE